MILVTLSLLLRACIAFKRKMYLCFQAQKLIILCCIIESKALEYLLNSWWLQAVKVGHCRIIHDIIIPVEQTIIIFDPDHSLRHDSLILVNGRVERALPHRPQCLITQVSLLFQYLVEVAETLLIDIDVVRVKELADSRHTRQATEGAQRNIGIELSRCEWRKRCASLRPIKLRCFLAIQDIIKEI